MRKWAESVEKTIKEIADELGLPKQRVYRYVKRERISESHQRNGVMYYDEEAEVKIKKGFLEDITSDETHREVLHDTVTDALVETLRKELDVKNEQIKSLNDRLAEMTSALLIAQQTAQTAQALHAGTIRQQLGDGEGDPVPEKKLRFFDHFRRDLERKRIKKAMNTPISECVPEEEVDWRENDKEK